MKNIYAVKLGRLGGIKSTPAKTLANKAKAIKYWEEVRAGLRTRKPREEYAPPQKREKPTYKTVVLQ